MNLTNNQAWKNVTGADMTGDIMPGVENIKAKDVFSGLPPDLLDAISRLGDGHPLPARRIPDQFKKEVATVGKKYEVVNDIVQPNPFAGMTIYCIADPCPQPTKTITVFKKGEIVIGGDIFQDNAFGPRIKIWKEGTPQIYQEVDATSVKPYTNPVSSIVSGTSSSIGNIVTSTTGKIVGGIILLALFLGLLKWRKVI